jgi:hypothetical protein
MGIHYASSNSQSFWQRLKVVERIMGDTKVFTFIRDLLKKHLMKSRPQPSALDKGQNGKLGILEIKDFAERKRADPVRMKIALSCYWEKLR